MNLLVEVEIKLHNEFGQVEVGEKKRKNRGGGGLGCQVGGILFF